MTDRRDYPEVDFEETEENFKSTLSEREKKLLKILAKRRLEIETLRSERDKLKAILWNRRII